MGSRWIMRNACDLVPVGNILLQTEVSLLRRNRKGVADKLVVTDGYHKIGVDDLPSRRRPDVIVPLS
jgi:hypothetical protein